jgi:oligopeptide transport system substrate-binding protein
MPITVYLAFGTRQAPFDDPRVRAALALAFDRDLLVSQATKGTLFPATGGFVSPGVPGHVPGISLPYDPELARSKLAEAGYPDGQGFPAVSFLVMPIFDGTELFDRITDQWRQVLGISISTELITFDDLVVRLNTERLPMWFSGWSVDYPDPDSFLRLAAWIQYGGWRHAEYESLIQDARGLNVQAQRMAMYRQAERILAEEAPIIPLSYARFHALMKPWVRTLPQTLPGNFIFKDAIIDPH